MPDPYLSSTFYIDCDHPEVKHFADSVTAGSNTDKDRAVRLYNAVRDNIFYDPYRISLEKGHFKASFTLQADRSFCIPKAVLLAAACRACGIPSRLSFSDVKNHITTEALRDAMGTDIFYYHGCTEIFLNRKWVKATPAFPKRLCAIFKINPLEFDGESDALLHEFDAKGHRHMEYVHYHGHFADLPWKTIASIMKANYPRLIVGDGGIQGDFYQEATPLESGSSP